MAIFKGHIHHINSRMPKDSSYHYKSYQYGTQLINKSRKKHFILTVHPSTFSLNYYPIGFEFFGEVNWSILIFKLTVNINSISKKSKKSL